MWPFADREGNPKIEPLVPSEVMHGAEHPDVRRYSTPNVEQQEEPTMSLRPSKSLSSLKLASQRRGLCIPPGAALSQSSDVCAQGEVSSPPRSTDTHQQPISEQTVQGHEQASEEKHDSTSMNGREASLASQEDISTTFSATKPEVRSVNSDQEAPSVTSPATGDVEQSSSLVDGRSQDPGVTPVIESKETRGPVSFQSSDSAQSSATEAVLNGGSESHANGSQCPEAVQTNWLCSWPASRSNVGESPILPHPDRDSSMASPIPIIRVQQTTESEETALPSGALAAKGMEAQPEAIRESISSALADQPGESTPALPSDPAQLDAVVPGLEGSSAQSAATVPELAGTDKTFSITPSNDNIKDTLDTDRPGITKLAVRKARNLAGRKFVLSILLGRKLAEQTKPQLQELARPPIRMPAKTVPIPGPSQVDGIVELEGELDVSRRG
jgi:hypothetical protein